MDRRWAAAAVRRRLDRKADDSALRPVAATHRRLERPRRIHRKHRRWAIRQSAQQVVPRPVACLVSRPNVCAAVQRPGGVRRSATYTAAHAVKLGLGQRIPAEWEPRLFIVACAAVSVLPLAVRGDSCGHDFDFHVDSWMEVASHWREGVFSIRIGPPLPTLAQANRASSSIRRCRGCSEPSSVWHCGWHRRSPAAYFSGPRRRRAEHVQAGTRVADAASHPHSPLWFISATPTYSS